MSGRREIRTSTSHCITCDQLSLHQTSSVRVQIEFLFSILPWLPSVATCSHVLGPTIDWATNTWQSQNPKSVRLISGVLVAIVARCFFFGIWCNQKSKSSCCHEMVASSSAAAKWHLFSGPCGDHADPPLSIPSLFLAVYFFLHCNCLNCSPGGVTYLQ